MFFSFLFSFLFAASPYPLTCPAFDMPVDIESDAPYVYMIDFDSGIVLLSRNGERLMHPSSMTKIMTCYLAMVKKKNGQVNSDSVFTVSRNAWRREGSSMFLNIDDRVSFDDLLKGIVIQSGNDASVVLAEGLSGSEAAYAAEMTRLAKELGATNTHFVNVTGLPDPQHLTTPKDLTLISCRLIKDFKEHYSLYKEKNFTYKNIKQGNRNPLLYKNVGCDGVKTGSSSQGGYGMVASCLQNGRRLVLLVNGLKTMNQRSREALKLMTWGLQTFSVHTIFETHQEVGRVRVYYGDKDYVRLFVEKRLAPLIPHNLKNKIQVKCFIPKALKGPVIKGQVVGYIEVGGKGTKTPYKINIISGDTVDKCGFVQHIRDSLVLLTS